MKVSFLSNLFARYPLERAFQMAAMYGYDGVEISGCRPHGMLFDMTDEWCDTILGYEEKYNLEVSMYGPQVIGAPYNLSVYDKKVRDETIAYVCKALDAAKKINTPRIQLTTDHPGYYVERKKCMDNIDYVFKALCEHAEKVGIDMIVEGLTVMESSTVVYLDDMLELFARVPSPHLKGMIDTAMQMTNYELYDEFLQRLGEDKMGYVHFGDNDGTDEFHHELGMGIIDFEEFVTILRRNGYDGWMSQELFSWRIRDPEVYLAQESKKIRKILEDTKHVQRV